MQKIQLQKPSKVVSFLLHPQFLFPLVILLPFVKGGETAQYLAVLLISFILPFSYFIYLYLTGQISDWDITKRKERYGLYFASLLGLILTLFYLHSYSIDFIFQEFLKISILAFIIMVMNFKIKVSIHVALVTVLCLLFIQYFEVSYLIVLLIPLIALSRVILKRHSVLEAILGFLVPVILYLIWAVLR